MEQMFRDVRGGAAEEGAESLANLPSRRPRFQGRDDRDLRGGGSSDSGGVEPTDAQFVKV